jgi:hypothetical protein
MVPEFQPLPQPGAAPASGLSHQPDAAPSTSLKWAHNGELSPVDLQRVLERLTDPSLTRCQLDELA